MNSKVKRNIATSSADKISGSSLKHSKSLKSSRYHRVDGSNDVSFNAYYETLSEQAQLRLVLRESLKEYKESQKKNLKLEVVDNVKSESKFLLRSSSSSPNDLIISDELHENSIGSFQNDAAPFNEKFFKSENVDDMYTHFFQHSNELETDSALNDCKKRRVAFRSLSFTIEESQEGVENIVFNPIQYANNHRETETNDLSTLNLIDKRNANQSKKLTSYNQSTSSSPSSYALKSFSNANSKLNHSSVKFHDNFTVPKSCRFEGIYCDKNRYRAFVESDP